MPTDHEHVRGFYAAAILVEQMLDEAQKHRPKRHTLKMVKSAAYREGYWNGLLSAHCMHTLGQFPTMVANAEQITKVLAEEAMRRA